LSRTADPSRSYCLLPLPPRGVSPGEYRIRARAFIWEDTSPFDNLLNVAQPVRIAPVSGEFPGGKAARNSTTETDPRFGTMHFGG